MKLANPLHHHKTEPLAPKFDRVRKYRPPPTSFHASIQAVYEEFGAPRTSKEVKQAYLDSHPNSDDDEYVDISDSDSDSDRDCDGESVSVSSSSSNLPPVAINPDKMAKGETTEQHEAALREAADREVGVATPSKKHSSGARRSQRTSPKSSMPSSPHDSPRASPRHSLRKKLHDSPSASPRVRSQALEDDEPTRTRDDEHKRASRRSSRQEALKQSSTDDAPEWSAAAQGAAVRRGEKPQLPTLEQTRRARERHLRADVEKKGDRPDIGKGSAPKPPNYPMTGIDNLALLMEDDGYTTSCFSIYMFKSELDIKTVDNFFEVLAETYPKYRYVVDLDPKESVKKERAQMLKDPSDKTDRKCDPGRRTRYGKGLKAGSLFRSARWRFVPDFDIRENIEQVNSPEPGDEVTLNELAGKFLGRHYDYSKPIWEALVVNGLNTADGGKSALMIKIHHCFSDGQGMIQSYHAALGALEAGLGIRDIQRKVDSSASHKKPGQREVKPSVWGTTKHMAHTFRGLYFRKRKAFEYQEKRKRVQGRLYCHSEGINMGDIKLIRKAFSTEQTNLTLNDVACAILARALRIAAERTEKNGKVKDKRVAVFVPISVRPKGDWSLSNATTGAIAWFRFEKEDDVDFEKQLFQVHREMNRIKRSYLPKIWFKTFDAFCRRRITYMPNYPGFREFFYRAFSEYHVATNVPGPPKPVKFGDHEAYSYHVLPPSSPGKSSLAIGMISYADDFSLAVSCDDVPEFKDLPKEICVAFQDAANQIVAAAKTKLGVEK